MDVKPEHRELSPLEKAVAKLAGKYGRTNIQRMLKDIADTGLSSKTILETLNKLTHLP